MSLSKVIFTNIDNTIRLYVSQIANKYNLDENELLKLWNSEEIVQPKENKIIESSKSTEMLKLEKKELVELCKSKNLKIGGTKKDLVDRILKYDEELNKPQKVEIVKKLVEKIPSIQIHKNNWGNFEHTDTSLVFNNKTQKIFGKQNKDGTISKLTKNDIDICNKYKFSYVIPDNLDKKDDNSEIKIKDLDDEDEVDENKNDDDEEFELEEELEEELDDEEDEGEEYYEEE